jgi:hypothetical protein
MKPLHFCEASAVRAVQMENACLTSIPCLESLEIYRESLRLVLGLAAAPGFSSMVTSQWAEACTRASLDVLGEAYQTRLESASGNEMERVFRLANNLMGQIVSENSPLLHKNLVHSTRQLEQIVLNCGPYVHGIFEGVLKTVLIQSWAAFEALTRTLWKKLEASNHTSIYRPDDKEWKRSQLGFGSRRTIRRTYEAVFPLNHSAILAALDPRVIDPLAILRNVIVHHAGKVDQTFKGECGQFPVLASLQNLALDAPIPIDGVLVRDVVDPALSGGYSLISAVDDWLARHP